MFTVYTLPDCRACDAIELERRQNREAIPATIADLARTYRDAGGDPA